MCTSVGDTLRCGALGVADGKDDPVIMDAVKHLNIHAGVGHSLRQLAELAGFVLVEILDDSGPVCINVHPAASSVWLADGPSSNKKWEGRTLLATCMPPASTQGAKPNRCRSTRLIPVLSTGQS